MKKQSRILAFSCLFVLLAVLLVTLTLHSFAAENATISYEFDQQIASLPGYGAGTITITPGTNSRSSGWYALCFANDNGVLKDYEPIATVAITAPPEIRVRRIMEREGISEEYARSRVAAQKEDAFFTSRCGYTLISDCASPEEFAARAKALFTTILNQ